MFTFTSHYPPTHSKGQLRLGWICISLLCSKSKTLTKWVERFYHEELDEPVNNNDEENIHYRCRPLVGSGSAAVS